MPDEPIDREILDRAHCALIPFVKRWLLPLNPEDLDEIALAVLTHAPSEASYEEIDAAVETQLDEYQAHNEAFQGFLRSRSGEQDDST